MWQDFIFLKYWELTVKKKKKKINPGAHRDVTTTALPHLDSPLDCGKSSQHILD